MLILTYTSPIPFPGKEVVEAKLYNLPDIGSVKDVAVEHIRTVAYYPIEDINEERTYYMVKHEPNDLDLVTVEAKFDVNGLYKRFYESFAVSEGLKQEMAGYQYSQADFCCCTIAKAGIIYDGRGVIGRKFQR